MGYIHVCVQICVCMCVHVCTCVCVYMRTCVYVCMCIICAYVYVCVHVRMWVYMCICVCVYVYGCVYMCVYVCVCTYTHMIFMIGIGSLAYRSPTIAICNLENQESLRRHSAWCPRPGKDAPAETREGLCPSFAF